MTINTYLEASTANLMPSTIRHIEKDDIGVTVINSAYGAWVAVPSSEYLSSEFMQNEDLRELLILAKAKGCSWLYIYRDADLVEEATDYSQYWD